MKKMIAGLVAGLFIGSAGMAAAATIPTVKAQLVKFAIWVDGEKQVLKNQPLLYNGTTYLPVRDISEMLGLGLTFNNQVKSISLKTPGGTASQPSTPVTTQPPSSGTGGASSSDGEYTQGKAFTLGSTVLKLNRVTYTTGTYTPAGSFGFQARSGQKFAIINFDVQTPNKPTGKAYWGATDFITGISVNAQNLTGLNASGEALRIQPGVNKTVEAFISIPEDMEVTSIQFGEPGSDLTAVIDLP